MSHLDRVMEAIEKGERDAQLLDGRDFDVNYWRQARRSLSTIRRDFISASIEMYEHLLLTHPELAERWEQMAQVFEDELPR